MTLTEFITQARERNMTLPNYSAPDTIDKCLRVIEVMEQALDFIDQEPGQTVRSLTLKAGDALEKANRIVAGE